MIVELITKCGVFACTAIHHLVWLRCLENLNKIIKLMQSMVQGVPQLGFLTNTSSWLMIQN